MKTFFPARFFFGALLLSIIFYPTSLWAADEQGGFTVSPAFQEVVLDQKDSQNFFVAVTNTTETLATIRISVLDFGSLDESGGVAFLGAGNDLEKKYALASWMRLEKDTLILASGETENVRVTIENRDSLSPGGHYGMLAFKVTGASDTEEAVSDTVTINQLFSTLVFVKKVGGEIYDLKLNGQEYKNNFVKLQDVIRLRFQNSGNIHLTPRGVISVIDPLGRVVAKGIINQESALILPETLRVYPVHLDKLVTSFVPGRYTLTTNYRYDGRDEFTTKSLRFDFIPPIAIVIVLLLAVAIGWYAIRNWRHKGAKKASSSSDRSSPKDV